MTAPRVVAPSREALGALSADLEWLLRAEPGLTLLQATRRLQLRTAIAWAVVAPLIEAGTVKVRDQGLFLA